MRRINSSLLAGTAGLLLGASGIGVAGAATGGSFLLGQANRETATASLSSDQGAPLALHAAKGQPPLAVNSSTLVRKLNAGLVGGVPAAALQRTTSGRCGTGIASIAPDGMLTCVAGQTAFTSSQTWVVPAGVHRLTVAATGGGGGGAVGDKHAGGGGAGAAVTEQIPVTPGERLDIVIGRGGAGATASQPAAGGSATVVYRQSRDGQMLLDAGGGHAGRAGRDAGACEHGIGGQPHLLAGATGLSAAVGAGGTCDAGGGPVGWPGSGGAPSHAGTAGAGEPGSVLVTLAA